MSLVQLPLRGYCQNTMPGWNSGSERDPELCAFDEQENMVAAT